MSIDIYLERLAAKEILFLECLRAKIQEGFLLYPVDNSFHLGSQ